MYIPKSIQALIPSYVSIPLYFCFEIISLTVGTLPSTEKRALMQERAAVASARGKDALGPATLYYGCRSYDEDFLYREELYA